MVKQIRSELASDDAFLRRFVAEAKTTVELSHPNIVPVYELGVEQGVYFIAMELAEGVTLAELLKASGPLTPEEGAYLAVEISRALDYAHRKAGIVHRDVTPRNVLIDEEGAVRLIDFGIAAPVSGENPRRERVFGSPGHMPPEQRGGGRLTPATDVFAVGALLLEAWSGKAPFRRATTEESDAAVHAPTAPPSSFDARLAPLDELLARAISVDAARRPQTAEDFARPLRDFLRSADLGDIARRVGERVRKSRPRAGVESKTPCHAPAQVTPGRVTPVMQTPATPSTTRLESVTETFATRDEVVEWTGRGSNFPGPIGAPEGGAPGARTRGRAPSRGRAIAVLGSIALGAAAVALAIRKTPESPRSRAAPIAPIPSASSSAPVEGVPVAPPAAAAVPIEAPSSTAPRNPDPPLQGAAETAFLNLTSDLQATRVTVDGVSVGHTPIVNLRKAPGKHSVTFVSAELGERLSTSLDVQSGETLRVVAEFTRPDPAITVRR